MPQTQSRKSAPRRTKRIRSRLSDVSWWMRLLSQKIAQRANLDDKEVGKFWQARYRAVRLLDETAILACAAYVDLNPIRAAMAETIETSDYTSAQQRALELRESLPKGLTDNNSASPSPCVDELAAKPIAKSLCPLTIEELRDAYAWIHAIGSFANEF